MKGSKTTQTGEDRELEAIRKELARAREKLAKLEAKYKKVSVPGKTSRARKGTNRKS
jgi:BMFP domain-containing protein YqiC